MNIKKAITALCLVASMLSTGMCSAADEKKWDTKFDIQKNAGFNEEDYNKTAQQKYTEMLRNDQFEDHDSQPKITPSYEQFLNILKRHYGEQLPDDKTIDELQKSFILSKWSNCYKKNKNQSEKCSAAETFDKNSFELMSLWNKKVKLRDEHKKGLLSDKQFEQEFRSLKKQFRKTSKLQKKQIAKQKKQIAKQKKQDAQSDIWKNAEFNEEDYDETAQQTYAQMCRNDQFKAHDSKPKITPSYEQFLSILKRHYGEKLPDDKTINELQKSFILHRWSNCYDKNKKGADRWKKCSAAETFDKNSFELMRLWNKKSELQDKHKKGLHSDKQFEQEFSSLKKQFRKIPKLPRKFVWERKDQPFYNKKTNWLTIGGAVTTYCIVALGRFFLKLDQEEQIRAANAFANHMEQQGEYQDVYV